MNVLKLNLQKCLILPKQMASGWQMKINNFMKYKSQGEVGYATTVQVRVHPSKFITKNAPSSSSLSKTVASTIASNISTSSETFLLLLKHYLIKVMQGRTLEQYMPYLLLCYSQTNVNCLMICGAWFDIWFNDHFYKEKDTTTTKIQGQQRYKDNTVIQTQRSNIC